ncbi:non-ribosomal peptide synthetase [Aulosira sp. FACHB-615]|uniref:non-ribosomal peptide synthetase n=1 Tax=Aulosira sp. FACHB-615 TaxID=2692777 RepID=UPI001683052A|nr:non-ribosomal peptide synthetase [Aulosira sp. FACHB-615]MBD2489455.1 amino acid adenylation domain-containing protein [Aulosira sp. FACHB-615]
MDSKNHEIIQRRSHLSPAKQAILEKRLRGERHVSNQKTTIPRRTERSSIPLSAPQQRLWVLQQLEPQSYVYNEFVSIKLTGNLNLAILEKSFNEIINRHESLRTSFTTIDEQPVQVIHSSVTIKLPVVNLSHLPPALQNAEVERLTHEIAQAPFNLAVCPLLRVMLLQTREQEYLLLLVIHHIICDGLSIQVLNQELAVIYKAFSAEQPCPLSELPIQYADYSIWQLQQLQAERTANQLSYWQQQLANASTTLSLPIDHPRPPVQSFNGTTRNFQLSSELSQGLRSLSKQQGVTLFMTLLAAFQAQLYRYTSQEDICLGSPIANRNHADIEGLIGFFVNTLVLRTDISGNPSFRELLKRVRDVCVGAYAHADLPFEQLVGELQPERNLSHTPLFQVTFAFQEDTKKDLVLPGLTLQWLQNHNGTAKFDLSLYVVDSQPEIWGWWEYNTDLFDAATIERMVGHFTNLLQDIITFPEKRLSELSLLTEIELQTLLVKWNQTATDYDLDKCIHQLFEQQVAKTPDAVAVEFANQQLTYQQLNTKANQLAYYLRSLGVKPEVLVGICVERSLDMIIGLLAILKAGGAYIPLDPNYPSERIAFILEDTQAPVLLTQTALLAAMPPHQAKVICLDTDWHHISQHNQENLVTEVTTENLAYIIYTSGSTGKPKGVMIQHASTVAMLDWSDKTFSREARAGVLASTSICFDLSVFEMFVPLSCGGKVILIENALYISNLPATCGVTLINTVPSVIAQLLQTDHIPASVQTVNIAGEPLQNQLVQKLYQQAHIQQVFNLYGPSEDTTYSTFALIQKGANSTPPIGRPIHNTQTYLLDENLQPVPIGVPGMLYLGGAGLARGYLNKLELTAERFIPHPYTHVPGERLYKTGDLARYLPNGEIEYIGRIDNQVKIRGFRIELGEIEAIISQYPTVRETVVVVSQESKIIAYLVPQTQQTLAIPELRNFLESKLPNYMVPAAFVILEALPLTPNGKIDRKALPAADIVRPELAETFVAPQTIIEKQLAVLWSEVLGLENIGINDNFFELGGDSILSLQVVSKANRLGLQLTPKQMFQYQTIAQIVTVIGTKDKILAEQGVLTGTLKLIPIQRWFFDQKQPEPHHWNQAVCLESKQKIDPVILEKTIQFLDKHHDVLRLRFRQQEFSTQALIVSPDPAIPLTYFDFAALPENQRSPAIAAATDQLQASLNLSQGPLFRVALFNLGDNQPQRLLWIIHHLAVDGVSWRILIEDLQTVYQQIIQGKVINLPPKTTSYQQWSSYLQKYAQSSALLEEIDFWLTTQHQSVTPIPRDFGDGDNLEATTSTVSVSLSAAETQSLLHQVPAAYRTQINDVLLTALILTFNQWTGKNSLLIDLEGHGREEIFEDVDLSRTVGWFTTIFPVHLNLENSQDLGKALQSIKEQLRAIPNRGIGYGLLRYLSQNQELAAQFSASKAEVIFNYLGQFDRILAESSLFSFAPESVGATHSGRNQRTHLLEINAGIYQGHLEMSWSYSSKLHRQTTIEKLAENLIEVVRSLIAHCESVDAGGFTPADFAEFQQSQWDQSDLDAITAAIGDI